MDLSEEDLLSLFEAHSGRIVAKGSEAALSSVYVVSDAAHVGQGSFGSIFRAIRTSDGVMFAAKVILPHSMNCQERHRVLREIRCNEMVHHFACVSLIEAFVEESFIAEHRAIVLILEYMNGGDLRQHLAHRKFMEHELRHMFLQMLLAMHHIHQQRILHRDISSANILVSSSGLVKVGDFGLSNSYDTKSTIPPDAGATLCIGSMHYFPPEQWQRQKYGMPADVWALGIVMYEVVSGGNWAFGDASDYSALEARVTETAPVPLSTEHCSDELAQLILSMLEKDPSKRPSADSILRQPLMIRALKSFGQIVSEHSLLSSAQKELMCPEISRMQLYLESVAPPLACDKTVAMEGLVKKLKHVDGASISEDRYLVLGDGVLSILLPDAAAADQSARCAAKVQQRPVDLFLNVHASCSSTFYIYTHDGNVYTFTSPDAYLWAASLRRAMGLPPQL